MKQVREKGEIWWVVWSLGVGNFKQGLDCIDEQL